VLGSSSGIGLARAFLTFTAPHTTTCRCASASWRPSRGVAAGSRYEWVEPCPDRRKGRVTEAEIEEVRTGADTLLNRAVDELDTDSACRTPPTRARRRPRRTPA